MPAPRAYSRCGSDAFARGCLPESHPPSRVLPDVCGSQDENTEEQVCDSCWAQQMKVPVMYKASQHADPRSPA